MKETAFNYILENSTRYDMILIAAHHTLKIKFS
jgi:hypothetical protein